MSAAPADGVDDAGTIEAGETDPPSPEHAAFYRSMKHLYDDPRNIVDAAMAIRRPVANDPVSILAEAYLEQVRLSDLRLHRLLQLLDEKSRAVRHSNLLAEGLALRLAERNEARDKLESLRRLSQDTSWLRAKLRHVSTPDA